MCTLFQFLFTKHIIFLYPCGCHLNILGGGGSWTAVVIGTDFNVIRTLSENVMTNKQMTGHGQGTQSPDNPVNAIM